MFSKPKLPLGALSATAGKILLFDEVEDEYPICAICLDPVKYNRFLELPCLHVGCVACLTTYAAARLTAHTSGLRFSCPLCRSTEAAVSCTVAQLPELGRLGATPKRIFALEDCYGNWHAYAVGIPGLDSIHGVMLRETMPTRAFTTSCLTWLSPYSGWIRPSGVPSKNPKFYDIRRAES